MGKRQKRIAVGITYFEEKELLTRCLKSLEAQTQPPDEILIFDDASKHPASEYVPRGFPCRIVRSEVNRKPSAGRNALLSEADSEYIHFHDADDTFAPLWCEKVSLAIDRYDPDMVMTDFDSWSDDSSGTLHQKVQNCAALERDPDLIRFAISGAILPISTTIRTARVREMGGYPEWLATSEDYYFHVRLLCGAPQVQVIPESLGFRFNRPGSFSTSRLRCNVDKLRALEGLIELVPKKNRHDVVRKATDVVRTLHRLGGEKDARAMIGMVLRLSAQYEDQGESAFLRLCRIVGIDWAQRVFRFASLFR